MESPHRAGAHLDMAQAVPGLNLTHTLPGNAEPWAVSPPGPSCSQKPPPSASPSLQAPCPGTKGGKQLVVCLTLKLGLRPKISIPTAKTAHLLLLFHCLCST